MCFFPLRLGGLINLANLSHGPEVEAAYRKDEMCQLKPCLRLLAELVKTSKEVFVGPLSSRVPSFVAYGGEDVIIDVHAVRHYFSTIEKSFHVNEIDGAFHEMHNEIAKYREPYLRFLKESLTDLS